MIDLFVLTADSDAEALLNGLLSRHYALRIRPITFKVQRFTGRDPGMVKEGPEIARELVNKSEYSRLVLLWDHEGSGWQDRTPGTAALRIQQRLDGVTWSERSAAIPVVPEIEEWLWRSPDTLARHLQCETSEFESLITQGMDRLELSRERCLKERPKDLFEDVFYRSVARNLYPETSRISV